MNQVKTVIGIVKITPLIFVSDASQYVQIFISRHNVIEIQRTDHWSGRFGFVIEGCKFVAACRAGELP